LRSQQLDHGRLSNPTEPCRGILLALNYVARACGQLTLGWHKREKLLRFAVEGDLAKPALHFEPMHWEPKKSDPCHRAAGGALWSWNVDSGAVPWMRACTICGVYRAAPTSGLKTFQPTFTQRTVTGAGLRSMRHGQSWGYSKSTFASWSGTHSDGFPRAGKVTTKAWCSASCLAFSRRDRPQTGRREPRAARRRDEVTGSRTCWPSPPV